MGIFRLLASPKNITTSSVAQRIMANHEAFLVFLVLLLHLCIQNFFKFEHPIWNTNQQFIHVLCLQVSFIKRNAVYGFVSYFQCRNAMQRRLRVRRNTMLRKSMSQETSTNIDMSRKPSLVQFIVYLCPPIEMPVVQYVEEPILCSWRIGERNIIWEYMQQRPGRIIFLQILMLLIVGL